MAAKGEVAGWVRWKPDEYLRIAVCALPLIDKGKDISAAFYAAQRQALHRDRRRELDDIRKLNYSGTPQKYVDQARALPAAERLALQPPPPAPRKAPPPRVTLDAGRDYGGEGLVRWTGREWALIARRVKHWQDKGDTRTLSRLVIEAQEVEFERDRRRPVASIQQSTTGGKLERLIADGLKAGWQIEHIALKPDSSSTEPAPSTDIAESPEAEAARIEEMAMYDPQQAAAAQAAQTAVEAPIAVEATTPPAPSNRTLSEAARAFGDTVMQALDKLLATHAAIMLSNVQAKLEQQAATTAVSIAAMIERGMRETVHRIVEVELGGPVSAPAAAAVHAPSLKVDVFAFPDASLQDKVQREVRATFNGSTDLRFVNPDTRHYTPDRERYCIMLTQRIPRPLANSITAVGIEPIYVKATPAHVVHAIEELHRANGTAEH
ncbi:MAG TPA: hypothetical protein VJO99_07085 [Burkholderiaceae bacterium]|nr:hypothetical protein [Burkholderiaceae bacterium]